MAGVIPRLSLHERVQHGLLALAVCGALATGLLIGSGGAAVRSWHLAAGFGALALLAYHVATLAVKGYVESRGWQDVPLKLTRTDWSGAAGELRHIFGGATERPGAGEFRLTQKLHYWWTGAAILSLGATGVGVGFWERFGTLALLPALAEVHRGLGLLVLATTAWHLYGAFVWEGRWWPEWSWLSGGLDEEKAVVKVPGAHARHLAEQAELAAGSGDATPEERARVRQLQERQEVQAELERGNSCALEERFVEALHHYRRALELYPDYSQAMYNMALVLARMGEREMARETYRKFLDADPFHPLARRAREAIQELAAGEERP